MSLRKDAKPLWDWMNERHRVYLRKQAGLPKPWTKDPILRDYRFCNVFRELDTVTVWIDQFIRKPYRGNTNLPFMLAVARTINWPPTLKAIMDADLWPTKDRWEADEVSKVMQGIADGGGKVYTGAYMIRAESDRGCDWYSWTKHEYITNIVLGRVWSRRREWPFSTLQEAHAWLMKFHGWGPFMAYEVITDIRHTGFLAGAPDIDTWANAGPGALRGINRLLGIPLDQSMKQQDACKVMQELLEIATSKSSPLTEEVRERGLEMRDIEHSLCETDKWLRVQNGEGRPRSLYNGRD